jgi:receptor-type tyrosine-protein phosphatase F
MAVTKPPITHWLYKLVLNAQNQPPVVPGAPPDLVKAYAESSTSIRVVWKPPPEAKRNGDIAYYKVFYVQGTRSDPDATMIKIDNPETEEFVIDELLKWTEYRIWMLAGTSVGDGPISYPVVVRTGEDGRSP